MLDHRCQSQHFDGFALASALALIVLIPLIVLAANAYGLIIHRRASDIMEREFARQNARAAMAMAIGALAGSEKNGTWIATTAENSCNAQPECGHWTARWSVTDGKATFSRWIVSGGDELVQDAAAPETWTGECAKPFADMGLPDRCPLEEICDGEKVYGHFAFIVCDETSKVRINLPTPAIAEPHIAQEFGTRWLEEHGLAAVRNELIPMRTFDEFREIAPAIGSESFYTITFCSGGLLQNTAGKWPCDLNWKLRSGNFTGGDYLFPGIANLPQPPPTLDLIASYVAAANASSPNAPLKFSSCGPIFRQLYAPVGNCRCTLSSLPNTLHGHETQKSYGIHPILCGAWLAISARLSGGNSDGNDIVELVFKPQFALWNPLAEAIEAHRYLFEWRTDVNEERWNENASSKPALKMRIGQNNPIKVPIGGTDGGSLFKGTFTVAFEPGQVLIFSPTEDYSVIVGEACNGAFSTDTNGCWLTQMAIARGSAIAVGRLVDLSLDKRSRWDAMTLRLSDAATESLLQEVADFVDEAPEAAPHTIPGDGNLHPIFQMSASIRGGAGPSPRWLADYNPRAPQVRRSARETFPSVTVADSMENLRTYPSWSVEIRDFTDGDTRLSDPDIPRFFGGEEAAVLFDVPRKFFSIAALQNVNLFPFSYHPAYAVGNSWAPPLLPRDSTWHSTASTYEYFTGEMLLDASYLANRALYDGYFIGGFEDRGDDTPATYTHCEAIDPIGPDTTCDNLAKHLVNGGVLNVNGASAGAWKIFLRSMPFDGGSGNYYLPRHGRQTLAASGCGGLCRLNDDDIDRLADEIVAEVRSSGPFASLSEFVNRHPGSKSDTTSRCGLLQRAIEKAQLRKFPPSEAADFHGSVSWFDGECASGDGNTACPADLSQADLLQFFGNSLTVRGDTFLIRSYGDGSDGSESNPISAVLEAIVRRRADDSWLIERIRWVR